MKSNKSKWMLRILILVAVATSLAFITLKLSGIFSWSWWWITAPLWGTAAAIIFVTGVFSLIVIAAAALSGKEGSK